MKVSPELVIKEISDILLDIDENDRALCDDIITNLEKTAVDYIRKNKVIKIPYIGNYAFNRLYLNLKEHHKELKAYRKTVDIHTYKDTVRNLVKDEKEKLNKEIKTELHLNKFRTKNKKRYYELATKHGVTYAKVWLNFHYKATPVPFDEEVQRMFEVYEKC